MTSKTRFNASQVLQFLFASQAQPTQRELGKEVSILSNGVSPMSDAIALLVKEGFVERTKRSGKEAVITLV